MLDHGGVQVPENWHLKKEVSIGTILVLIVYGVSAVALMSRMDERLASLERAAVTAERIAVAETNIQTNREAILHLEARTLKSLDEIKNTLERIERRVHGDRP